MARPLSSVTSRPEQLPFIKAAQLCQMDEFYVLDAIYQPRPNDTYGPQFRYKIRYKLEDGPGMTAYLSLPEGPAQRRELFESFRQSREVVGPLKLRYVPSARGQLFYLLIGPDDDRWNIPVSSQSSPDDGGDIDLDDDDLPF